MSKPRLLFNAWADRSSVNAQNLNARDIALRLNPAKYQVSLFCQSEPDPRFLAKPHIELIRIPRRLATPFIARHLLGSRDLVFYSRISPADDLFRAARKLRRGRKKLVAPIESELSFLADPAYPPRLRAFFDDTFQLCDTAVANTDFVAETIRRQYGMSVPVIFSGVDRSLFARLGSGRKPAQRPRVLFAGSFQERKHPELVVEAAARFTTADFTLIGDGPLRPALEKRVAAEKLSNVAMIRTLEYPAYAERLSQADVFLFPSRIEGLPKVTLEAASAGIPVLVFDDYRTPSVVDGLTGYQVKTFDEMLARLGLLLRDEGLRGRMGRAASEHARRFDWDALTLQWERLFDEVLSA